MVTSETNVQGRWSPGNEARDFVRGARGDRWRDDDAQTSMNTGRNAHRKFCDRRRASAKKIRCYFRVTMSREPLKRVTTSREARSRCSGHKNWSAVGSRNRARNSRFPSALLRAGAPLRALSLRCGRNDRVLYVHRDVGTMSAVCIRTCARGRCHTVNDIRNVAITLLSPYYRH